MKVMLCLFLMVSSVHMSVCMEKKSEESSSQSGKSPKNKKRSITSPQAMMRLGKNSNNDSQKSPISQRVGGKESPATMRALHIAIEQKRQELGKANKQPSTVFEISERKQQSGESTDEEPAILFDKTRNIRRRSASASRIPTFTEFQRERIQQEKDFINGDQRSDKTTKTSADSYTHEQVAAIVRLAKHDGAFDSRGQK